MKTLEKWYVWDGKGDIPFSRNSVKKVIFDSNIIVDNSYCIAIVNAYVDYWLDNLPNCTVAAYTLGEQVESKRVCSFCGNEPIKFDLFPNLTVTCHRCKRG